MIKSKWMKWTGHTAIDGRKEALMESSGTKRLRKETAKLVRRPIHTWEAILKRI
jgi:hypothetical protein